MANESQFSDITALVGNVYKTALLAAREGNVMASLVTTIAGGDSSPYIWSNYSGGTFATITEATDMTAQTFNPAVGGTLTQALYGQQMFLTDLRIRDDVANVQRDAGLHLGGGAAEHIDTNLSGLFTSLTGGTAGAAGGTITWANIFRAQAYLRTNKVFGSYACVLHPVQWYYLTSATTGVPTLMQNTSIAESIIGGFYQASFGGIDFFVDANISSGTAAIGGMFGREALAIRVGRPFNIEYSRDGSRGGGGYELNATMQYAYGVYRPTYGVKLIGTSA